MLVMHDCIQHYMTQQITSQKNTTEHSATHHRAMEHTAVHHSTLHQTTPNNTSPLHDAILPHRMVLGALCGCSTPSSWHRSVKHMHIKEPNPFSTPGCERNMGLHQTRLYTLPEATNSIHSNPTRRKAALCTLSSNSLAHDCHCGKGECVCEYHTTAALHWVSGIKSIQVVVLVN